MLQFERVLRTTSNYPHTQASRIIGERARRYLVMFMEVRDIYIYIYIRASVSNTHVRVKCLAN